MASMTAKLVASVVGKVSDPNGWAGPVALATVPVIPAVALAECSVAAVRAVRSTVSWLRRQLVAGLRSVADALDPLPVAEECQVAAPVEEPAPVILPMPSAAQVTTVAAPALRVRPAVDDLAAVLAENGSARAAARALGIPESTLRGRLKRQGIALPKRR